jgi:hypothetical protein
VFSHGHIPPDFSDWAGPGGTLYFTNAALIQVEFQAHREAVSAEDAEDKDQAAAPLKSKSKPF